MTGNQKKLIAVACCVITSLLLADACKDVTAALGASTLASVSAGGGAFGLSCGLGLLGTSLFTYTDSPPTPPGPNQPGAPTT
ncbi:hypothetical protein [Streptomyces sp. NBC_00344]|uniref:hypothetical protein n=1 Tax=Streptomyces sp. NBC_00344 TaxID=2975720 RepID=UPI002E20C40E